MDIVMVVTVSVVIIGIITCLLYIDTLNQLLSVKRFFPKTKNRSGFSDILNYAAAVENGIIICKDGSFIAAYEYFTQDNASTSDEEQAIVGAKKLPKKNQLKHIQIAIHPISRMIFLS